MVSNIVPPIKVMLLIVQEYCCFRQKIISLTIETVSQPANIRIIHSPVEMVNNNLMGLNLAAKLMI